MKLIVISPEGREPRERAAMEGFFMGGLDRYHVRKPAWSEAELESWILGLPGEWRPRMVLHQHRGLVARLGLGGFHERDTGPTLHDSPASRSCHDLESLRAALRSRPYVIFGPVFPSLTKKGHAPAAGFPWDELAGTLGARPPQGSAQAFAIGGVTEERLPRCRELGFDGAAVLGAVWMDAEPVRAFIGLRAAAERLGVNRHAA